MSSQPDDFAELMEETAAAHAADATKELELLLVLRDLELVLDGARGPFDYLDPERAGYYKITGDGSEAISRLLDWRKAKS